MNDFPQLGPASGEGAERSSGWRPFALTGRRTGIPEAWFLGPKAENERLLQELVTEAVCKHAAFRRAFHPDDPVFITPAVQASDAYREAVQILRQHAGTLFGELQRSVPFASMRYQGHMLWDQALPAMVGYIGALLYNQNNVAAEASPFTTFLEIQVGNDLCRMLGFPVPAEGSDPAPGAIVPWGHITCDGSVANIEGLWAARNAKFFPLALQKALRGPLGQGRDLEIALLDGTRVKLIDIDDPWVLLNLRIDDVVSLPHLMSEWFKIQTSVTNAALQQISLQNVGLLEFYRTTLPAGIGAPVATAPATRHYSWPKAATLVGLGQNGLRSIEVDLDARQRVDALHEELQRCKKARRPVIAVVAVMGSTEEGAVDPLDDILALREELRREGMDFAVHCDAAWGGYFNAMLIPGEASVQPSLPCGAGTHKQARLLAEIPDTPISAYVEKQYRRLKDADSITVDPHKSGYAPYPAGGLCYRNSAMRDQISLKAPVVFHSEAEPTVGVYGVEGSKPGAAAAAVWLAHKVIPTNRDGYGKILDQCMWTATRLYCRLVTMRQRDTQSPRYGVTVFQRLPAERDGSPPDEVERQRDYIRKHFVDTSNEELAEKLRSDEDARRLFGELGSDQLILAYTFNLQDRNGRWNTDMRRLQALNSRVFEICSMKTAEATQYPHNVIVTTSQFDYDSYGPEFMRHYERRLGIENPDGLPLPFLISTTMDPWTTDTPQGDFLAVIEAALRGAVNHAIRDLEDEGCHNEDRGTAMGDVTTRERPAHEEQKQAPGKTREHDVPGMEEDPKPPKDNNPDRHAFFMLGDKALFLCHMTMFHMEGHAAQLILRANIPESAMEELRRERAAHPGITYFLGNSTRDLITVPELASGAKVRFTGDIFRGIPDPPNHQYVWTSWPWDNMPTDPNAPHPLPVQPIMTVPVEIERVVYYWHFVSTFEPPRQLTYLIFGAGDEAHMTNCQTREPDYDHVMTLAEAPDWLPARMLEAGVHVSTDYERPANGLNCENPFPIPSAQDPWPALPVRYRGDRAQTFTVKIKSHLWYCTKVINAKDPCNPQGGGGSRC